MKHSEMVAVQVVDMRNGEHRVNIFINGTQFESIKMDCPMTIIEALPFVAAHLRLTGAISNG